MTLITYTEDEIIAVGHSGYSRPSYDIVCAGVSTAFKMAVGVMAELDVKFKFESKAETGFIGIQIDEESIGTSKPVVNVLLHALKSIAKEYPENVQVHRTVPTVN